MAFDDIKIDDLGWP